MNKMKNLSATDDQAFKLKVLAKEKESVRRKLAVKAEKLRLKAKTRVATAKEKESVRRKLAVKAEKLRLKAKLLALTAKEKESVRRELAVTAEKLRLKAKLLALTAKEKESVRRKLAVTAEDLEQIRVKNEAMLVSIGDGLVVTDKNERILLVNKAFENILGWKKKEVMGKFLDKVIPMVDENGKVISSSERLITKTIKKHATISISIATAEEEKEKINPETMTASGFYYYVRKDKTRFPVAVTVAPVKLGNKFIGAIEVFRDITQEKEIDKAKSEFISLASHQLKTPPTAIKLVVERLLGGKMGTFTEKQKEYLNYIHFSNQRMIDLINALLNVSRIELGAFTIQAKEKDAYATVQSILDELKYAVDKKQLKLKIIPPEKQILLMLDESLFRMVMNNIVTNAIHYTAEGGEIRVECKVMNKGQFLGEKLLEEDYFVVIVADTGYGIPQKDQNKLFTKFFRADNAREKSSDGTGLGLYIAKSILEQSSGLIWFTSRVNKGSEFYVAIPIAGMRAKDGKKGLIG
ncbi:MAG: PAS domain-containing sensor histidine kinase [bacterium]|nr:PAS domain-containing sensor histidine kinase [bacterium]